MLVLSRQKDESIVIADVVVVTVVDVRGDRVRLGIEAPREIDVHRKEVWEAIQRENAHLKEENERLKAAMPNLIMPPTVLPEATVTDG